MTATIRGLRYPVETILELLSSGMTIEEILADHEDLERDDILAVLAFAARLQQGVEAAVLVPIEEWCRLQSLARPTLKELLLAETPRAQISVPPRQGPECHTSEDTAQRGWRAVFGKARREDVEAVDAITAADLDRIEDEQK